MILKGIRQEIKKAGVNHPGFYGTLFICITKYYYGRSTLSITWMTPFEPCTSVANTFTSVSMVT